MDIYELSNVDAVDDVEEVARQVVWCGVVRWSREISIVERAAERKPRYRAARPAPPEFTM